MNNLPGSLLSQDAMQDITVRLMELLTVYGLRIVAAIVVFIVGRWVARLSSNIANRVLTKKEVTPTIVSFIVSLIYLSLLTFVSLAALGHLGIQTTSFIAIIGAAGFLMIIFRPFKVGDYIDGAGVSGTVKSIQIFTTQLATPDNKMIIIPNAKLTADNITNFSTNGTRRVDLVFGIGYTDDMDKAKEILVRLLDENPRVLKP